MDNLWIDNFFAKNSPMSNASYLVLLFEAGKPSVIACSNVVPPGVIMMTHTLGSSYLILHL